MSIITTKTTGVIIGAINIEKNIHDSRTLQPAIEQQQRLTGITLKNNYVDRLNGTAIVKFNWLNDGIKSPYGNSINSRIGFEF